MKKDSTYLRKLVRIKKSETHNLMIDISRHRWFSFVQAIEVSLIDSDMETIVPFHDQTETFLSDSSNILKGGFVFGSALCS